MSHFFLFGLSLGLSIGPMALLILHRSIRLGGGYGLSTALGVTLADVLYGMIACTVGPSLLGFFAVYRDNIELLSSIVLSSIGLWIVMTTRYTTTPSSVSNDNANGSLRTSFMSGFLLTLSNPLTVIVCLGFVGKVSLDSYSRYDIFGASLLFGLGSGSVNIVLSLLGASIRDYITPLTIRIMSTIAGLGIVALAWMG